MYNYKLTIELVPQTAHYSNVRSNVSRSRWDQIRKKSYLKANNKCEICNDVGTNQGRKHAVECHEIWKYDDSEHTQTLIGLISLCPNCHQVKHAGLANINGKIEQVIKQLMKVNFITYNEAINYLNHSFELYQIRSQYNWKLNINYLDTY